MRPGLTSSILAFLACLLTLTWLLFSLLAFKTAENDLYAQKSGHARLLLSTFINQLPPFWTEGGLPHGDQAAIYARMVAEEPGVECLVLSNRHGGVIFSAGRCGDNLPQPDLPATGKGEESSLTADGTGLVRTAPVASKGVLQGRATLLLSVAEEQKRIKRTRQMLVSYFLLDFVLLLLLGGMTLSRIVVTPVERLLVATEKITGGVYGHQVKVGGARELAGLAEAFNTMSAALEQKQIEAAEHLASLQRANQELELAREEAFRSEKMASVGLLAAGTAHEIGSPLASIIGYAELLSQEPGLTAEQADYIKRLQGCSGRIDRIIKGLLEYARPKQPVNSQFYLSDLIRATVELIQHQGGLRGVECSVSVQEDLAPLLLDQHQFQQVVINLLINANDAMPEGGKLDILVAEESGSDMQFIRITDSGSGIAPEHLGQLFDPFFTTKPPGKGTGLGLALSARIIDGMGGRITASSRAGEGSCFTIFVPTGKGVAG